MEHTKSARRLVYVLNPAAGKGKYLPDARRAAEEAHADIVHLTERQGECIDFMFPVNFMKILFCQLNIGSAFAAGFGNVITRPHKFAGDFHDFIRHGC